MDRETGVIDRQNQQRAEWLSSKVSRLKSLALDIEDESKAQVQGLLTDVDSDMDSVSGFMSGTFNRINYMVRSGRGNRKFTCYVMLCIVTVCFVLYYMVSRAWSSAP